MTTDTREFRAVTAEVRAVTSADGKTAIRGYGLVYGSPSVVMRDAKGRPFREYVAPDAAARSLADADLVVNAHHDDRQVLGRKSAGTARFGSDARGLWYEADLPDTSYARDLAASVARGDVAGSSFVFATVDDEWSDPDAGGVRTRTLRAIHVFDMGPVVSPAYTATTAALATRSLDAHLEARDAAAPPATTYPTPEQVAILNQLRLAALA